MDDIERVKRLLGSYNHDPEHAELYQALTRTIENAERYRWLRKRSPYQASPGGYVAWPQFSGGRYCGTTHPNHDELDAEIDAAMRE